jgi:hypothetical protein
MRRRRMGGSSLGCVAPRRLELGRETEATGRDQIEDAGESEPGIQKPISGSKPAPHQIDRLP